MEQKNTKPNNYQNFIYLFRYISSVEKDASFSLLALISLLWHCVKLPGGQSHFLQKVSTEYPLFRRKTHEKALSFQNLKCNSFECHMKLTS